MSSVTPIGATSTNSTSDPSSIYSPPSTTGTSDNTMDSSMFLQLLVTQLQNQDPSNPMDTDQMISQTTELAMMEQLENLSSTQNQSFGLQMRASAANLLGQTVDYTDANGKATSGVVSSVSFAGDVPVVTVGSDQVSLDDLTGASLSSSSTSSSTSTTNA